ncbi:MAG: peptidoglycan DD-metalloendopeptidase family protein [Chloroflexi bacterium]|nr:peptidoglycan DD-metalloendopeptidase family protein [Chloroflexota bacterium]
MSIPDHMKAMQTTATTHRALAMVALLSLVLVGWCPIHPDSHTSLFALTPTPTASPTIDPGDAPTATPASSNPEHFWFGRPIPPSGADYVSRFYPYGSTAGGELPVHHGVEFVNPTGTPVLAVADATVVWAGDDHIIGFGPRRDFYGTLVVLEHHQRYNGQRLLTLYGHLSRVLVERGQVVRRGEVIGEVGMTGVAMGPHLHFEVRVGRDDYASTRNPELWLEPYPGRGVIAGRLVDGDGNPIPQARIVIRSAGAGDDYWREIWTYASDGINPDDEWGENFALGDVPAGLYIIEVKSADGTATQRVGVTGGKISFVNIQVQ